MNRQLQKLQERLLGIHDSAHRIALGAALGLLLGVLPGTGPIAAVTGAFVLRANKAAALAGALLVNTWINVVTFPLALAIGAFLFRIEPSTLARDWTGLIRNFSWREFLHVALRETIVALFTGYALIGLVLAIVGYFLCYQVVAGARKRRGPRPDQPAA